MSHGFIRVRGARQHNLKGIDVDIPRDKLVVVTGLSGSGKSSLAFDTIYAEGQRRYVESLSAYARQFLEQAGKPDVDMIEGLSPAISIEQKNASRNPRSTVGTTTEIADHLRVLFARIGKPHCPVCGKPVSALTVQQIVDRVLELPAGTRFSVLAPIVRDRKGEYRRELEKLRRDGFVRVNIDGEVHDLVEETALDKNRKHTIEVYVDRLVIKEGLSRRLTDSVETAVAMSDGLVRIAVVEGDDLLLTTKFACVDHGIALPELAPRTFSFNNPHGACPTCSGLGDILHFDPALIVPDPSLSLRDGAVAPWSGRHTTYFPQMLAAVARTFRVDLDTPWSELPEDVRHVVLHGTDREVQFTLEDGNNRYTFTKPFEGVIANLDRRSKEYEKRKREAGAADHEEGFEFLAEEFHRYARRDPCPDCKGARLRREALAVRVAGKNIAEVSALTAGRALAFLDGLQLTPRERQIADRLLKEVRERLRFLINVGLDYLTLDRASATLSGGEAQRIRLATQIGASLVGVIYILDEPSIGLHQRDNRRLIDTLLALRDMGNTVLVVEHDREMMESADWIIDLGPGAGRHGGEVVVAGTPDKVRAAPKSLTGRYLADKLSIELPQRRRRPNGHVVEIKGVATNNLRAIDVRVPLGVLVSVTGVSGSGKSSLVVDTLLPALRARLHRTGERAGPHKTLLGTEHVDKVVEIDQQPIGRTPRSNPATYTGLFGPIRDVFAALPESRARGYGPGRYSFNVAGARGGRCETCEGQGVIRVEMHFLPDVYVVCEECGGRRYNRDTLDVKYRGRSIADVLDMSVEEALELFEPVPKVALKLQTLFDVGLGYIQLGQSATTLSGGEAQRIKLARELSTRATGRTMYVLDEPTTGLHFDDIKKLLGVLARLVDQGNTVVVIEHNLDVIKTADWVIDLGPEGGDGGGKVIATGTPEQVSRTAGSYTGQYLKKVLGRRA
ncbi:MAG: excinuclease ABC subunit UvrA [Deltaproteobacteria bacterium]|nr:excinuclease ABC subunit UvrA [Deltaproteobacteria bacterium]